MLQCTNISNYGYTGTSIFRRSGDEDDMISNLSNNVRTKHKNINNEISYIIDKVTSNVRVLDAVYKESD